MTGEEIRKLRTEAELTQQQLATAVGVTQSTVWTWESNTKKASAKHVEKIKAVCKAEILKNSDKLTVTLVKQTEKAEKLQKDAENDYQRGYANGYSDCVQTLKNELEK